MNLKFIGYVVIIFFIGFLSAAGFKRNNIWLDEYILNTDNIFKTPLKARPYLNRGLYYFNKGMTDEAIKEYRITLELAPLYSYAYNNIGVAYYKKGEHDMAIIAFKEAIRLNNGYAEAHYNLGVAYGDKGLTEEAWVEIKKAMELNENLKQEMKSFNKDNF